MAHDPSTKKCTKRSYELFEVTLPYPWWRVQNSLIPTHKIVDVRNNRRTKIETRLQS